MKVLSKNYIFVFCIFSLFSCDKNNSSIEVNATDFGQFQYKANNEIEDFSYTLLKELNEDTTRGYKLEYKKDRKITKVIDTVKVNYDASFDIETQWTNKITSILECENKLRINLKELSFVFCHNEVLNYLNSKKEEDIIYMHYENVIESIISSKSKKTKDRLFNNRIVSNLIKSIPFSIEDNSGLNISKVAIGDFNTGYSVGSEHYIIDKKNDTIAYFEFTKWVK